jgi:hypothetical protein
MDASSHIRRNAGKQTITYPIRVSDHALEKLRGIGIAPQHSNGDLKNRIAVTVWDHLNGDDHSTCDRLGDDASHIVILPESDPILGIDRDSYAIVVPNTIPGDDGAEWAVTTIMDDDTLQMRSDVLKTRIKCPPDVLKTLKAVKAPGAATDIDEPGQGESPHDEPPCEHQESVDSAVRAVTERIHDDLILSKVIVIRLNEDGGFEGLMGFPSRESANNHVNGLVDEGITINRIIVLIRHPLVRRIVIG